MSKISVAGNAAWESGTEASSLQADRRRANRSALTVRIDYSTVDEIFSEFTRDINEGGLFIETEKPHLPGTEVSMQFHLPGSHEVVETVGRVVRVSAGGAGVPPGMGIEFDELKPDDRKMIDRIVRALRSGNSR
ncbi:TIGR02266 family protein [Myxococcota bacterium]|nr:TIGR02266 family protein [Myxococcota bacterium]